MANVEVPMEEEASLEARMLLMKLILGSPDNFTLSDLIRLKEILTNEGCLKQDPPRVLRIGLVEYHPRRHVRPHHVPPVGSGDEDLTEPLPSEA